MGVQLTIRRVKVEQLNLPLSKAPEVGDPVVCDACNGKGWYSVTSDDYSSEHTCGQCRRTGTMIIVAFDNAGAILKASESDWVYGEDGDYS